MKFVDTALHNNWKLAFVEKPSTWYTDGKFHAKSKCCDERLGRSVDRFSMINSAF